MCSVHTVCGRYQNGSVSWGSARSSASCALPGPFREWVVGVGSQRITGPTPFSSQRRDHRYVGETWQYTKNFHLDVRLDVYAWYHTAHQFDRWQDQRTLACQTDGLCPQRSQAKSVRFGTLAYQCVVGRKVPELTRVNGVDCPH